MWRRLMVAALVLAGFAGGAAAADPAADNRLPPAPMHEQVLTLPGDPMRPVALQVTLFEPPGSGPFPLAVLNHGASSISNEHRGERYRFTYSADYFLSRGYAVALPMARGFAGSGGTIGRHGCDLDDLALENARDIAAVIKDLSGRAEIDATRVVVAGQSFGGWVSLGIASLAPPGVHGVVVFVPTVRASDCTNQDAAIVNRAAILGHTAKLHSLWFYGDNDGLMPTDLWHHEFEAYHLEGAQAELVAVGKVANDSHEMLNYPGMIHIWAPKIDAFLTSIGLPSANLHPEYLPIPPPSPSHFAAIDDVAALPVTNEKVRDAYRVFLKLDLPRVFLLSANGGALETHGGFDPLGRALEACRQSGHACRAYAVDNDVVWTKPDAAPRIVRRDVPSGQRALLNFAYAVNADCTSSGTPKFTVTSPPMHGAVELRPAKGRPTFVAGSPFASCNVNPVPGIALLYMSSTGFVGQDSMTVQEFTQEGTTRTFRFDVTVTAAHPASPSGSEAAP